MTSYKVAFIKTNAFQKKVAGKNYYEGYDNQVEGSVPIYPFFFTEDYNRSWDSGNPFSYSSLRNGEIESIDYDSSKLTVKFLNYDTFSYEEKVYEVGVLATDEKIVDPSDHSKLFEFTPTEILVADSLNSGEPILETLRDSIMEFEQNKGKIPKMAETFNAYSQESRIQNLIDNLYDDREIALNKLLKIKNASLQNLLSKNALLRDRVGGLSLAQWSQVQNQLKYTPSGRIRNFDAETFEAEGIFCYDCPMAARHVVIRKDHTDEEGNLICPFCHSNKNFKNISETTYLLHGGRREDLNAETFEARTTRKSRKWDDKTGKGNIEMKPDGKQSGLRGYDRSPKGTSDSKLDWDSANDSNTKIKANLSGKEDLRDFKKHGMVAEYVACAECGDYVYELESNTCCEECNDNLNEAFEWIAKENGEENLRDFMDSIDITDDDLNAETFEASTGVMDIDSYDIDYFDLKEKLNKKIIDARFDIVGEVGRFYLTEYEDSEIREGHVKGFFMIILDNLPYEDALDKQSEIRKEVNNVLRTFGFDGYSLDTIDEGLDENETVVLISKNQKEAETFESEDDEHIHKYEPMRNEKDYMICRGCDGILHKELIEYLYQQCPRCDCAYCNPMGLSEGERAKERMKVIMSYYDAGLMPYINRANDEAYKMDKKMNAEYDFQNRAITTVEADNKDDAYEELAISDLEDEDWVIVDVREAEDFEANSEGHGKMNWTLNYNDYPNCCPFHQKYTDVMSNSMPCGEVLWGQGFSVDIEGKQYNIWGHEVND